jgi:hypothetical protein
MSEEKTQENLSEQPNKVAITPEDATAALDFWKHFNIPIPASMQQAFDNFVADPTFPNQERVKYEVTNAISTTDHEAFKDDMFEKIREECADTAYSMAFDKQLEETLTVDKK